MASLFSSVIAQGRFLGLCGRVKGAGLFIDTRLIATTSCWLIAPSPPPPWTSRSKTSKRNKNNDPIVIDTSAVNLYNRKEAQLWVDSLTEDERSTLRHALQYKIQSGSASLPSKEDEQLVTGEAEAQDNIPDMKELCHLAFHQGIPFVGFGFLDNFIMILAGDYIDNNIGVTLAISTMVNYFYTDWSWCFIALDISELLNSPFIRRPPQPWETHFRTSSGLAPRGTWRVLRPGSERRRRSSPAFNCT